MQPRGQRVSGGSYEPATVFGTVGVRCVGAARVEWITSVVDAALDPGVGGKVELSGVGVVSIKVG